MSVEVAAQSSVLKELSPVLSSFSSNINALKKAIDKATAENSSALKQAEAFCKIVIPAMDSLRTDADKLEAIIPKDLYPFPTYGDLLFNV